MVVDEAELGIAVAKLFSEGVRTFSGLRDALEALGFTAEQSAKGRTYLLENGYLSLGSSAGQDKFHLGAKGDELVEAFALTSRLDRT